MTTWLERLDLPAGDGPVVAVKDLIDVEGSVTTGGCRALAERAAPAERDARCVADVRRAGGRLAGKVNLHELAFGTSGVNPWYGTPPNPADPGRVPGGSSSGSAVAVAMGEADVALGTDTGGSVRIPAACCAVVGLKTSYGLISLEGVWPLAPSYDTVGVLAADVAGVVVGMELLGRAMPAVETPAVVGRAVMPGVEVDPVIDAAVDDALRAAGLGAQAVVVEGWTEAFGAQQRVLVHEAYLTDRHLLADGGAGVGDDVRARLEAGRKVTDDEVGFGRRAGVAWTATLSEAVSRFGALVLPTLAVRPPTPEDFRLGFNLLTSPVNFAGLPAISVPVPASDGRPPCGLQLVGAAGSEPLLCRLAARVEEATVG